MFVKIFFKILFKTLFKIKSLSKRCFLLAILLIGLPLFSSAKVLVISDVDDTLKLAHVRSLKYAAYHAADFKSRFFGMASLLRTITREQDSQLVYLSNAPEWLMKNIHTRFLEFGQFPSGIYRGRDWGDKKEEHKLKEISNYIRQFNPSKIILIGDNGELDSSIYSQIYKQFHTEARPVLSYIRVLYGLDKNKKGIKPTAEQLGFMTPFEIVLDLEKKQVFSPETTEAYIENEGLRFLTLAMEPKELKYVYFQDCHFYSFPLNEYTERFDFIEGLATDIERFCSK